jgi:hypothetical protein
LSRNLNIVSNFQYKLTEYNSIFFKILQFFNWWFHLLCHSSLCIQCPIKCLSNFGWLIIGLFWVKNIVSAWVKISVLCNFDGWKQRKLKETCRINDIILIKELNRLCKNGILLMCNVCCGITYVLKQPSVWNYLLHWLCTIKLIVKQYMFHCVCFRECSVWDKHHPWCSVMFNLMSVISSDMPSPSFIPTSRNWRVSSLTRRVTRNVDLHCQPSDFRSTSSSVVWLDDKDEVEHCHVATTCLIWPWRGVSPKRSGSLFCRKFGW